MALIVSWGYLTVAPTTTLGVRLPVAIMSFSSFLQRVWAKFRELTPFSYALAFGTLIVTWLLLRGIYRVIYGLTSGHRPIPAFLLKHLVYPLILPRMPLVGAATRLQTLLVIFYLLPNFLFVLCGPRSEVAQRAATMALVNLILLLCGPRLGLVTKLLGISLRASIGSHQWIGRTAVAQVLLHTFTSLAGFAWTTPSLFGVVVGSVRESVRGWSR